MSFRCTWFYIYRACAETSIGTFITPEKCKYSNDSTTHAVVICEARCSCSCMLHCAPCAQSHTFHFFTVAYQAVSSAQPAYVNSMLTPARHSRQLRSTSSNPLYNPRVKTKAGTRTFSVAAPTVWNSLLASVKSQGNIVSFHRRLKNYLLNAAYPP